MQTNAAFIMTGGKFVGNSTICSNGRAHGGGVAVDSNCTFMMSGGEISGNTATSTGGTAPYDIGYGGGVWAYSNSAFTMSGGKISGNTVTGRCSYGGGVSAPSFTMSGGEISGNTSTASGSPSSAAGGGVYTTSFTMSDGEISGNTAVNITANGSTTMASGGGVYTTGLVTISGNAKISGNTAKAKDPDGGGVWMWYNIFNKTGNSIIYGNTGDTSGNTVKNMSGAIVNKRGHAAYYGVTTSTNRKGDKYKDSTAGSGVNLSASYSSSSYSGWDGTN
jgi:predicted outer membrane repeat protein